MKKRILGILLSCLLLLSLMPTAALAVEGELPDLSKETWAAHKGHEGWTAISTLSGTTLTLNGGSYYLDADRALKSVTIEGDVTLCLNGKTLSWEGADTNDDLITVESRATLHLCDCAVERGAIAGQNYGGALIAVSGTLEMYQADLRCGARLYAEGLTSAAGSTCVVQGCSISQTGYDKYSSDGVTNSGEMTLINTQVSGFGVCVTNYKGELTMSGCRVTAPQFCALVNSRGMNKDDLRDASAELTGCVLEKGSLGNYVAVYNGGDIHSSAVQLNAYAGRLTLTGCAFGGLESSNAYRSGRHELDPGEVVVSIRGGSSSGNISNQGQMTIKGCVISGVVRNSDSYFGGNSLYPAEDFRLVMEGCTVSVTDDTAVEVNGGAAQLTGCVLSAVCTEPNLAYTVDVSVASATLKNCTVSMDASQVTQLGDDYEIQALTAGYPFSGVNVYTDGAVELSGGSIEAKGPFACGLKTSLLEGAEMSVTDTKITAPVGVSARGAAEGSYPYYYIDGEYSEENSVPFEAGDTALVLDGVEIEAEKYGVECGGGVTIRGSSIHGGEAGLYREGVVILDIFEQSDTPYGDIVTLLLESDFINMGGRVSLSNSTLSGGSFAAYQAGVRCVDYIDLVSGGSGSFDPALYPELKEDLEAAVGRIMLGSGVTLEGETQLGSSVLSGISAEDESGAPYDGGALSVGYYGTPAEGDPIIENVTEQTQGLFALKYPQDWKLIPSADGGRMVLHYSPTVYHKITATAGEGGAVSPSGEVSVEEGTDQTFTFAPEDGWRVASVKVDGRNVRWSGSSYTFSAVTADHTLEVGFKRDSGGGVPVPVPGAQFVIDASANAGGSISPEGRVPVPAGGSRTFAIVPGEGHRIVRVLVDGVDVGAVSSYTFENVREDHSIEAVFAPAGSGVSAWLETSGHPAYLSGYEDGSFAPDSGMTRAEAAQMFYNLLLDKDVPVTAAFSDVPADAWYADAVNALASLGILQGVGEGVFAPGRPITRAEFAAIALRFTDARPAGQDVFSDVGPGDWFCGDVSSAAALGWINGYEDGSFRPWNSISRAEVAAVVNRMLGRSPDRQFIDANPGSLLLFKDLAPGHWAYYQIVEAANAHDYLLSGGAESWTGLK